MGPQATTIETLGPAAAPLAGVLCLVALGALIWRRPTLRGTTLVAPWGWGVVTVLALAGAEACVWRAGSPEPPWAAPLRFAAAMSTFCPTMAVLGAKRPQDRPWQVIVLSLWFILSLPSIEWLFFGGVAEIHPARFWFLVILIAVGAINGLGTRYWPASLLFCAAQVALLVPFFRPGVLADAQGPLVGISAITLGWLLQAADWPRRRGAPSSLDRAWLDFRDLFGLVWALRIAERMNTSGKMYDWPVRLSWRGFRPADAVDSAPEAVAESFRTLLRRFVSPEWIDARLVQPSGELQSADEITPFPPSAPIP